MTGVDQGDCWLPPIHGDNNNSRQYLVGAYWVPGALLDLYRRPHAVFKGALGSGSSVPFCEIYFPDEEQEARRRCPPISSKW